MYLQPSDANIPYFITVTRLRQPLIHTVPK
jgi:hypothetical protein